MKEFGQLFQPVDREGSIDSLLSSLKDLALENGGVPDLAGMAEITPIRRVMALSTL